MAEEKTLLDTDQIIGFDKKNLTEYLLTQQQNVSPFKGSVDFVVDLAAMTVPTHSLVYVKEKKMFYVYDGTSWAALVEPDDSSAGTMPGLKQVTRLGVVATAQAPVEVVIPIPHTTDFKRPPIEVLEFQSSGTDVLTTQVAFDNADAGGFEPNPYVEFDGTMHLKTRYEYEMVNEGALGTGTLFSHVINKKDFKAIERIEVK